MPIDCVQERMLGTQCRESAYVPVPGDTIGTITTRILAVDLLQKQPAQSINSRLGCFVKPIGSADPVEEVKVGFENRLYSGFVRKRAPNG
jgi:hypothetical protein